MLAAVLIACLVSVAGAGVHIGAAVVARHRAQAAADLAALAGAAALPGGAEAACGAAGAVIAAMSAALGRCDVEGLDVVIGVAVPTGTWMGGQAYAAARAGPVAPSPVRAG